MYDGDKRAPWRQDTPLESQSGSTNTFLRRTYWPQTAYTMCLPNGKRSRPMASRICSRMLPVSETLLRWDTLSSCPSSFHTSDLIFNVEPLLASALLPLWMISPIKHLQTNSSCHLLLRGPDLNRLVVWGVFQETSHLLFEDCLSSTWWPEEAILFSQVKCG